MSIKEWCAVIGVGISFLGLMAGLVWHIWSDVKTREDYKKFKKWVKKKLRHWQDNNY